MKKIQTTSQKLNFYQKRSVVIVHITKNADAVLSAIYIQTISQNKKENQALRSWIRICRKRVSPKTL